MTMDPPPHDESDEEGFEVETQSAIFRRGIV
jgi:hypothetical protein